MVIIIVVMARIVVISVIPRNNKHLKKPNIKVIIVNVVFDYLFIFLLN